MIKRLEETEGGTDFFSAKLKEDIATLRSRNEHLRSEISSKAKGFGANGYHKEEIAAQYKVRTGTLRKQLYSAEDVCKNLQEKQELCVSELRTLVEHTEELVNREGGNEREKENLNELLSKLTGERNELIFRMNTLTERYNQYVREMAQERADIIRVNKSRQRMLASSILFAKLLKGKAQRLRLGVGRIKAAADYFKEVQTRITELAQWQSSYRQKLANLAFQRWKHNVLNWAKERELNLTLLEKERTRRQRAMVFSLWQTSFRDVASKRDAKAEASHRICELYTIRQARSLRTAFGLWYKSVNAEVQRDLCLKRVLLRLVKKYEEIGLVGWIAGAKEVREREQLELLAESTAQEKFGRQMFARLKHNLCLEEDMKVGQAQLALDKAQREKQKARYLKNSTIVLMTLNRRKNQQLEEEAFNGIKFNLLAEQKERASRALKTELPEVETLEKAMREEEESQSEGRKKALLRTGLVAFRRNLRYFLERWRNSIPVYIQNAIRLKRILKRFVLAKTETAFNMWRHKAHERRTKQNQVELKAHDRRMESLDEALSKLASQLDRHKQHMSNFTLAKLERIARTIARRYMHRRMFQWRKNTVALNGVETGVRKAERLVERHVMGRGLDRLREWSRRKKEETGFKNKCEAVKELMKRNAKKVALRTLVNQINSMREIKNGLRKFFRDKENNKVRRYLNKWRSKAYTITKVQVLLATEQLAESTNTIQRNIEISEKSKRNLTEDITDLDKHERNKALLAMFKNFAVHCNDRMLIALKVWQRNTFRSNSLRNLLVRYIKKKEYNAYRLALANWQANKHSEHISAISEELREHVRKHDTFSRLTLLKITETDGELKDLRDAFCTAKASHEADAKKVEAIAGVLNRMRMQYKEVPASHNFLLGWNAMTQREKRLQARARRAMQVFTGKFIYARLKKTAQENHMQRMVESKCAKLHNIVKRHWLRKGLSSMRVGKRTCTEEEQNIDKQDQEAVLEQTLNELEVIREHSRVNNEKEVARRRLLKDFLGWRKQAKFQRLLKKQTELLNEEVQLIRVSGSFNRWHNDFEFIMGDREKMNNARKHHDEVVLNKALEGWHKVYKQEVTLPKVLEKLARRQHLHNMGYAIEKFDADIRQKNEERQSSKQTALLKFTVLLTNTASTLLSQLFATLVQYGTKRRLDRELVKRVFLKLFFRKLSDAFNLWKLKADERKLVDEVEFKGKSAMAAQQLAQQYASIKELLARYRLESVHRVNSSLRLNPVRMNELVLENQAKERSRSSVEEPRKLQEPQEPQEPQEAQEASMEDVSSVIHLEENKELQASVSEVSWSVKRQRHFESNERALRKFILRWTRRLSNKQLAGTYTSMWLNIIKLKKTIRDSSDFVLKRLVFGSKAWAFGKLKNLKRAGLKTFEKISRPQLLKQYFAITSRRIYTNGNDLEELEEKASRLGQELERATAAEDVLAEKLQSGKSLAITVMNYWVKKPIRKALLEWKLRAQQMSVADMENMVRDKLVSLQRLEQINRELEVQNGSLLSENESLRHSSIDGLEIANVVYYAK